MSNEDNLLPPVADRRPIPDPTLLTTAAIEREIKRVREENDNDWQNYKLLLENKFQSISDHFDRIEEWRRELKEDRIREVNQSQRTQDIDRERMRELSEERLINIRREVAGQMDSMLAAMKSHRDLSDAKLQGIHEAIETHTKQRDEQKRDNEKNIETARLQAEKALSDFMERYQRAHDELWQMAKEAIASQGKQVDEKFAAAEKLVTQQRNASELAISKSEAATSEQLRLLSQPIADLKDRVGAMEAMRLGAAENRVDTRAQRDDSRANIGIWIAAASVVLTIVLMVVENSMKVTGH